MRDALVGNSRPRDEPGSDAPGLVCCPLTVGGEGCYTGAATPSIRTTMPPGAPGVETME